MDNDTNVNLPPRAENGVQDIVGLGRQKQGCSLQMKSRDGGLVSFVLAPPLATTAHGDSFSLAEQQEGLEIDHAP
jgi:hypothetical protein